MRTNMLSLIALFLGMSSAWCSEINTGGKIFLMEPGARALGVAGCGSLLGESYSGLYNPAAQVLTTDVNGSFYINPEPYFGLAYDFVVLSIGARSEFGSIGFSYLFRDAYKQEGRNCGPTDGFPSEEASVLVFSGRPHPKIGIGVAFKILVTEQQKAFATPINESPLKNYKMAFDFGLIYSGFFPESTFGQSEPDWESQNREELQTDFRGLSFGVTFQNIGGKVDYENSIEEYMLPQLFRGDLMWYAYKTPQLSFLVALQAQKLLVERNTLGGYHNATKSFFQAWSGSDSEGGWVARLGYELTIYRVLNFRMGWSRNYRGHQTFTYFGFGVGPEWLKFSIVQESKSDGFKSISEELRYGLTAGISYTQLRDWTTKN